MEAIPCFVEVSSQASPTSVVQLVASQEVGALTVIVVFFCLFLVMDLGKRFVIVHVDKISFKITLQCYLHSVIVLVGSYYIVWEMATDLMQLTSMFVRQ